MMKNILITLIVALALLLAPGVTFADVTCPMHPGAPCYDTGAIAPDGVAHKYHCVCGDDIWVR